MDNQNAEPASTTEGGVPDLGADPQAPQNGEGDSLSLMDRVRSDPDFAVEQLRKRDAKISEQANYAQRYKPLEPFVEMNGGAEGLLKLATHSSQIRQVPGLAELVEQSIQTGQVALPQASQDDPDDEFLDEDTRRIRDEFRSENEELKRQLVELKQTANAASARSLESQINKNLDSALDIFKRDPEVHEEAMDVLTSQVEHMQRLAEQGDATQIKNLEQLSGPEGVKILKFMTHDTLLKHLDKLSSASSNDDSGNEQPQASPYTDGRTVNPPRPDASPVKFVSKEQLRPNSAREVMKALRARRGLSTDDL